MRTRDWQRFAWLPAALLLAGLAGCGKPAKETPTGQAPPGAAASTAGAPAQVAQTENEGGDEDEEVEADAEAKPVAPAKGTPEWFVHETTRLRLEPPPETEDASLLKEHRRQRNLQIVELAHKAIAATHDDPKKERLFDLAVRHLMEARLQLAMTGDEEQIEALYDDAGALFKRDPKSAAAAEGAHALANMAYYHAQHAQADAQTWIEEFARQSRHFAENFPKEERRALPLLYTAARSCEAHGLMKTAASCFDLIKRKFPRSQYATHATAILRRHALPGNPPRIAGPTLDDDHFSIDDLLGRPVLVVFWSTTAEPFQKLLPRLRKVIMAYKKQGLAVVGVNLDLEEQAVRDYVLEQRLSWTQIFFEEPEKRGWNNPVATYYGILEIPALWLVDQSGNVVSTSATIDNLADELALLLPAAARQPGQPGEDAGDKVIPTASESDGRPSVLERPRRR